MPKILPLSWMSLLLASTLVSTVPLTRAAAADAETEVAATKVDATRIDAAAFDADWIVQTIARPVETSTPFVEVRSSPLLKEPLRIEGEYRRPDADTLVREVRSPYAETTTLSKGKASIAREGRRTRTFSLSRAPELASLQQVFGSLLAGDSATVGEHYRLEAAGTQEHWSLLMTPKEQALAKRVRSITLHGGSAELRCIETESANGKERQRTLLAGGAIDASGEQTEQAVAALCSGTPR